MSSNIINWQDTKGSQGNSYAKPFVLQMLSPSGWLLTRKVNGVPTGVRYDREYVGFKLYNEAVKPFENTMMSDSEVFSRVIQLVAEGMKYRNPDFQVNSEAVKNILDFLYAQSHPYTETTAQSITDTTQTEGTPTAQSTPSKPSNTVKSK